MFSIFQIVKFNNDACPAIDGTTGTCYTASECTANGGQDKGPCASGFGVCCVGKKEFYSLTRKNFSLNWFPGEILVSAAFYYLEDILTDNRIVSK